MSIRSALYSLGTELKNAIAPDRCISCLVEDTWYCKSCRKHTPPHILQCIGCKSEAVSGRTCGECLEDIPLTGFISAELYSTECIQRGIEWLKFKGIRPLAEVLAGLLIPKLSAIASFDDIRKQAILIPLPLHKGRRLQRGFNQSEDIARSIGTMCSLPVHPLLTRVSATASQARLPHELRTLNVKEAFALHISQQEYINITKNRPIVIIVDDVSTTGATLISAARAFPPVPNVQIWGAVIARG